MAFGDVIARLAVSLNLETASFERNSQKAVTTTQKMKAGISKATAAIGGAFAGISLGAAVNQFRDMGKAALESAGSLGETASALGVSTGALQEFRFAATQVGLSTEQMDAALGQFSKRLGAAELSGKGPFVAALNEIGLSLDDLKGKSETEQIGLIADGINKVGSAAQQSALQVAFFGKTGQATATLLQGGSAGIAAYAEEARKLGVVLSDGEIARADETADKLAKLNFVIQAQQNKKLLENADAIVAYEQAIGDMKLALIEAVGGLQTFGVKFEQHRLKNAEIITSITGAFAQFTEGANKLARDLGAALTSALGYVTKFFTLGRDMVQGLANGIRNNAGAVWDALKGIVTSGIARAKGLLGIRSPSRVFMEIGQFIGEGLAIGIEGGSGRVAKATKKLTDAARRAAEEIKALFARLFPEIEAANKFREEMGQIEGSGFSDDAKGEARRRLLLEATGNSGDVPISEELLNQGPLVDVNVDEVTKSLEEALGMTDKLKGGWANLKQVGADAFGELSHQLKGVLLGAQSLGDAIRNLVARLADMALSVAFNALGGALKIPGYASGTLSAPRGLALVGERGPELVQFRGGERVYDNDNTRGMIGGSQVHSPTFVFPGITDARQAREAGSQAALRYRRVLNGPASA